MRDQYYSLIKSKGIQDTLMWVEDLPYSKKYEILDELLKTYSIEAINSALYNYEVKYIRLNRINSFFTRNVLIGLCRKFVNLRGSIK